MELKMAIADWVREATERRRQRIITEALERGRSEVRREAEAYNMGYEDADKGRPFGFSLDAIDKPGKKRKTG